MKEQDNRLGLELRLGSHLHTNYTHTLLLDAVNEHPFRFGRETPQE